MKKFEELPQGAVSPAVCVHLSAVAEYDVKMQILNF